MLKEILGSKKDEVNIMRNFSVVRMLKSRKLQCAKYAARIMEAVNAYIILRSSEDQERGGRIK
jgi:hypothetical protein